MRVSFSRLQCHGAVDLKGNVSDIEYISKLYILMYKKPLTIPSTGNNCSSYMHILIRPPRSGRLWVYMIRRQPPRLGFFLNRPLTKLIPFYQLISTILLLQLSLQTLTPDEHADVFIFQIGITLDQDVAPQETNMARKSMENPNSHIHFAFRMSR